MNREELKLESSVSEDLIFSAEEFKNLLICLEQFFSLRLCKNTTLKASHL